MSRAFGILLLVLVLAACGSNPAGNKNAVKKAAQEQADYFASQDYGGVYDMWVDSAKKLMTRDDYIALGKACDLGGVPTDATFIRFENKNKTLAVVRIGLGKITGTYMMRLEDGDWSWIPSDDSLAAYKLGLQGAVDSLKKDGSCD